MEAKSFFLVFDGGCTAPYHIIEKRGKFVGSLWLGVDNLRWVLQTWGLLQKSLELKGFFQFNRTEYSTLEFSCLQNQRGRFVELCEYHGGAQRGGIRVPEGYLGKGWHRFAEELREGRFRNGKLIPNRKVHDLRDPPAKISHPARNVTSTNSMNLNPFPRVILDPDAIRPTRKYEFEWKPRAKTLCITKTVEGKRQVEWVGLKYKAQGLIQRDNWAFTQVPCDGPREPMAFDGPGEPVRNDQSLEHVDEAVLDQLHTQGEIQVEIEPTSIQSFKDPVSEVVSNLDDVAGEASRDQAVMVVDYPHQGAFKLVPMEPLSPIANQELELQPSPSGSDMEVSELQLSLLETTTSEEPASPLSCPLNILAPPVAPPLLQSCKDKVLANPSKWVSQHMNYFWKHVGVSISEHEPECMALLIRLDKD